MERNTAVVVFKADHLKICDDLEIPLFISANELISALDQAYQLGFDPSDVKNRYLKAENPIAFLKGTKTLEEYGVRNGTVISCAKMENNNGQ